LLSFLVRDRDILHTILYYTIRLPVFDGREKKERLSVLRVV